MFTVKAHYYADPDQFGESFVLTSDNGEKDLKLEIGKKVRIFPIYRCGKNEKISAIEELLEDSRITDEQKGTLREILNAIKENIENETP